MRTIMAAPSSVGRGFGQSRFIGDPISLRSYWATRFAAGLQSRYARFPLRSRKNAAPSRPNVASARYARCALRLPRTARFPLRSLSPPLAMLAARSACPSDGRTLPAFRCESAPFPKRNWTTSVPEPEPRPRHSSRSPVVRDHRIRLSSISTARPYVQGFAPLLIQHGLRL